VLTQTMYLSSCYVNLAAAAAAADGIVQAA
jgi:hypothetical protein